MDFCEDCEKDVPATDDMARCPACADAHDERWSEGGETTDCYRGPSLDEQMEAARGLK